ncbi:hypothetical protein FACS189472_04980 [Alphaproteobacteria bacterium]|nr:hypothetical protein FACS189472_04980 [Alphaproteobacteria bacterium]
MKNRCLVIGLAAFATSDVACMNDVNALSGRERHHSYETLRNAYNHVMECDYPQAITALKPLFDGSDRPVDALHPNEKAFAIGLIANSHYYMKDFEKASSFYHDIFTDGLFHHIGNCYEIDGFCNNMVKPEREWDFFSKYRTQMNDKVMFLINSSDAYSQTEHKDFAIDCLEQLFIRNKEECNREGAECYADFICGIGITMTALNFLFELYKETGQYSRAHSYAHSNLDILKRILEECNCNFRDSVAFQHLAIE